MSGASPGKAFTESSMAHQVQTSCQAQNGRSSRPLARSRNQTLLLPAGRWHSHTHGKKALADARPQAHTMAGQLLARRPQKLPLLEVLGLGSAPCLTASRPLTRTLPASSELPQPMLHHLYGLWPQAGRLADNMHGSLTTGLQCSLNKRPSQAPTERRPTQLPEVMRLQNPQPVLVLDPS